MPSRKLLHFSLFFLLLLQTSVFASTVLYDDSRGLSNNHVTQIIKDKTGVIWIATQNGLNTFDGYSFKEIDTFRGMKINALSYDQSRGFLWIGSNKGLYKISLSVNKIIDYTPLLKKKEVSELFAYNDLLYVVFFHGSVISINSNNEAKAVFGISKLGTKSTYLGRNIATDRAGNLFFTLNGTDRLVKLNLPSGAISIFPEIQGSKEVTAITSMPGYCISYHQDGSTNFLGTKEREKDFVHMIKNPDNRIGIFHSYGNEFYASLRDRFGVFSFNPKKKEWEQIKSDESISFKSKVITCMMRDAYNILWIGTNKGLIKIDIDNPRNFKILFDGYSPPVSNRQIVEKTKDEFFIATYSGIYNYPLAQNKPSLIDANRKDTVFPLYTRALLYDTGYLYAGTESHSNFFYRVDLKTQTCEGYFFKPVASGEPISAIYGMMRDNNNIIWLASDLGLASYNKKKGIVNLHTNDRFSVDKTRLFYFFKSKAEQKFWVSGRNAFYLVDENDGVVKKYTSENLPKQLPADDFIFISEDDKDNLWIGTKKSGIIIFNVKNNTSQVISRADGLSANEVYGVLWQNDSTAWISTINGLCRYNTIRKTFNNYFYDDGLSDNEFNQNSFLKGSNGNFYFGGINGINYFNPETITERNTPLTIFQASVVKWNQGLQTFENAINNGQILMSPQDHLLTFTFGLSDFSQTEGHSYFYRIKGLYDNWVSLGNQNILRLEGLPAGSYKVEMMGYNKKGNRSQNTLEYSIEIEQVFYKIWWFYVLIALAVVLMIYGYFKWRLRNLDLKLKLRTQIASNLHDEVGSLLTSIIISTDSARYSSSTAEEKDNKLEKISMLSRDATNTMSDVLWSIDARNDYAGNLTDRMREQAEAMLLPLGIEVESDFTATQQEQNINPDTRQQLYLIFKEAINNIAKHSRATTVKITYKQQGNNFELVIQNNNHTREAESHVYSGQGLKNMQMRAKKIGARCIFDQTDTDYKITINN